VCLPPPPVTLKPSERPRFIHRPQCELTCSCVHLLSAQLAARSIAARFIAARSIARSNVGRAPQRGSLQQRRCRSVGRAMLPPRLRCHQSLYHQSRSIPPIALYRRSLFTNVVALHVTHSTVGRYSSSTFARARSRSRAHWRSR
jgi:hypothetical protein